jgi:hypothetical protein
MNSVSDPGVLFLSLGSGSVISFFQDPRSEIFVTIFLGEIPKFLVILLKYFVLPIKKFDYVQFCEIYNFKKFVFFTSSVVVVGFGI